MAYMDQSKKSKILAALKPAIPADWKYSVSVRHHSTIVLTIASAPVDLIAEYSARKCSDEVRDSMRTSRHASVNPYWFRDHFEGDMLATFDAIVGALNLGNHNRSDLQSDYHDVGHYVEVNLGKWDKPFQVC